MAFNDSNFSDFFDRTETGEPVPPNDAVENNDTGGRETAELSSPPSSSENRSNDSVVIVDVVPGELSPTSSGSMGTDYRPLLLYFRSSSKQIMKMCFCLQVGML